VVNLGWAGAATIGDTRQPPMTTTNTTWLAPPGLDRAADSVRVALADQQQPVRRSRGESNHDLAQ
jgi:hypothetical protein